MGDHRLRGLAVVALNLAGHQQVEGLVRSAELDVGAQGDRVVGLGEGVEELVHGDRLAGRIALGEVVALQQPRDGVVGAETYEVLGRELVHPLTVEADLRTSHVEQHAGLLDIGGGVPLHLLFGEGRTRLLLARRIADARREVAHQEDRDMPELLEALELLENDGVTDVDVR